MDHWEIALKIVGPVLGAAVAYSQRRFFARPRAKLRTDLELLNLLEGEEVKEQRETLLNSVTEQIERIYGRRTVETKNYALVVFGLIWALGFVAATIFVIRSDDWSRWWAVLTGWLAFAGVGWMIMGWEGRFKHSSRESGTVPIEIPANLLPQVRKLIEEHVESLEESHTT
jgi:hypothetical protein